MVCLINRTARAITVADYVLIPGKPVPVDNITGLKKLYPAFSELLNREEILAVNKAEAKKAEADFAAKSDKVLKERAAEKGEK